MGKTKILIVIEKIDFYSKLIKAAVTAVNAFKQSLIHDGVIDLENKNNIND